MIVCVAHGCTRDQAVAMIAVGVAAVLTVYAVISTNRPARNELWAADCPTNEQVASTGAAQSSNGENAAEKKTD